MTINIEKNTIPAAIRTMVDKTVADLLTIVPGTRAFAASIISMNGLVSYIGGHHVAILHPDLPERLALVTHDAPDWQ